MQKGKWGVNNISMEEFMKVKCLECGFEDDGKYCSNCGALLPQTDLPFEQQDSKVPAEISWLDKCLYVN